MCVLQLPGTDIRSQEIDNREDELWTTNSQRNSFGYFRQIFKLHDIGLHSTNKNKSNSAVYLDNIGVSIYCGHMNCSLASSARQTETTQSHAYI